MKQEQIYKNGPGWFRVICQTGIPKFPENNDLLAAMLKPERRKRFPLCRDL